MVLKFGIEFVHALERCRAFCQADMVGKCRNVEIVSGGIAINHEKGLDAQRLLNCWQSKAAPILDDDLRRFERRRASLVAQSGSDLVDIPQHHFALNTTVCVRNMSMTLRHERRSI